MVQQFSLLGYLYGLDPDPNPGPWLGPPYIARRLKMFGLIFTFSIALTHRAPPNRNYVEAPGQLSCVSECVDSDRVVGTEDRAAFDGGNNQGLHSQTETSKGEWKSRVTRKGGRITSPCHLHQPWHCGPPCQALHPGRNWNLLSPVLYSHHHSSI